MWAVLANEITGLVYPRRSVCQPVKDEQGKPEAPDPGGVSFIIWAQVRYFFFTLLI